MKFFPGERKPVLLSDDAFLRLSDEVTKLYPPDDNVESSAAEFTKPPIVGWQFRKNCPNRPISEFRILGEDGETISILETAELQPPPAALLPTTSSSTSTSSKKKSRSKAQKQLPAPSTASSLQSQPAGAQQHAPPASAARGRCG